MLSDLDQIWSSLFDLSKIPFVVIILKIIMEEAKLPVWHFFFKDERNVRK